MKKMTQKELAAGAAAIRAKRRAHVLFTCGEEGIVALTFEVIDSEEGPYHLKVHSVFYTAEMEDKLKTSTYWPYWMKQRTRHGGFQEEDDPLIRREPGAFMKDDGQIDQIEYFWIHRMGLNLMGVLACDVRYTATTRIRADRENYFPFIPKHLRGV